MTGLCPCICACLIPPVGVWCAKGCKIQVLWALLLSMCFGIPGMGVERPKGWRSLLRRVLKRNAVLDDRLRSEGMMSEDQLTSSFDTLHEADTKILLPSDAEDSSACSTPTLRHSHYGTLSSLMHLSKEELKKRRRDRAVTKHGICNFKPSNIRSHRMKYLYDLFTTLLELQWRWTLLTFGFCYVGSWFIFACFWYLIIYLHGDLENTNNPSWSFCVTGIKNFVSAFLFSVETQHTTGYGYYHITDQCPDAILLLCVQSIFGVIMEGLLVGLVFVKMARAKKRNATLLFSRNAVICQRDGTFYFMFRVADMRTSNLLSASVRAQLVRKRVTMEGEIINYQQEELNVGGDGEKENDILLFWPTTIVHKMDSDSPLYQFSSKDFGEENRFEIIVILEGIVESTGLTTQARSSYLPSEILWGHRFQAMCPSKSNTAERRVDFSLFHATFPVKTPETSPANYDKLNDFLSRIE